jgi:hypothetical protein
MAELPERDAALLLDMLLAARDAQDFVRGVNTPPPKGGGFRSRLKAGFGPPFGGLRSP